MAEVNKEKISELFDKFIKNAEEERELALERYRRQDVMIETSEDFVMQGKNAVDFLKTASQRSDAILDAVKLMKDIVYKDDGTSPANSAAFGDELKKQIKDAVDNNELK